MMSTSATQDPVSDSPGVQLMPPAVFLICLVGGAIVEWLQPLPFPPMSLSARILVGLVVGSVGFGVMMWAHNHFERLGTNVPTNQPATTFVQDGAYRYSRNPMYLGGSALFLGLGLTAGSWWLLSAYLPLGLYLNHYVIPREEAYLRRIFGDSYRTYCGRVRRWL